MAAQLPKLVIPIGHVKELTNTEFSSDSKLIATSADDKTIKLWDPTTGRLLKTLYGHKANITTVAFSPKGNYLLSSSKEDGTNRIWDLQAGQEIITLQRVSFPETQLSFSKDEKWAIALQKEGITLLNLQTSKLADSFKVKKEDGSFHYFSFTAISNDGKLIAAYDYSYHQIFIWDRATNRLLKKFIINPQGYGAYSISFSANSKQVYLLTSTHFIAADIASAKIIYSSKPYTSSFGEAVIINNGRYLFTGGTEQLYKLVNKNDTMEVPEEERYTYMPSLLDMQTFKTTYLLSKNHPAGIQKVKIDEKGKKMQLLTDDSILIYNIVAGKLILSGKLGREVSQKRGIIYYKPVISPDGKYILTTDKFDMPVLYDTKGKRVSVLTGTIYFDREQYYSDDGNNIYTEMGNQEKFSWDLQNGKTSGLYDSSKKRSVFDWNRDPYKFVVFDSLSGQWVISIDKKNVVLQGENAKRLKGKPDGNKNYAITFASGDSTLKVWDAKTGILLYKSKSRFGEYQAPVLSNDNRFMGTVVSNASVQIDIMWDNLQKEIDGDTTGFRTKADSPNEIRIVDLATGKELLYLKDTSGFVYNSSLSFSGASKYFSFSADQTQIWRTDNWEQVLNINSTCGNNVPDWGVSPDGQKVVVSCNNNSAVYKTNSNELLFELQGAIGFASFSDDGKRILTESDDMQMKIFDASTGKLYYTFYAFENGNYIVTDSYDRYDGTEEARKKLYYACGNEIIDLEQFKDQLWVPNLAERIMNGDSINAPKLADLNICGLTPEIENKSSSNIYQYKIIPRRGGLGETVLYVNGIEAKRYKPPELKKMGAWYELIVKKEELKAWFVAGKENPVTVKAFTADNTISSRGIIIADTADIKVTVNPSLYAVMVGISDYKGDELDLKYAAKDATDFSAALASAAKKLLNTDEKEHVFIYNLTTNKDRYQLPEKNSIKNILEEIGKKATSNDILLIFFAGHGIMTGNTDKKQFYFLTADASPLTINRGIQNVGISTAELTEWMKPQNIKAQKRILIFDACNSGQAINDFVQVGKKDQGYVAARNDDKSQQIKAIDKLNEKSGFFILSASATNQNAYEMGRYSQGLLTYSLLKAIKQQPDILEQGKYLNISSWFNAAENTVSELSAETGARQEPQIVSNTNFIIGIVDDEIMASIILPEEKPLFAASNFQNNDEAIADDDLELSKLINLQFNDMAARGNESNIAYVTATNSPDAYSLTGRYTVINNKVTVTVNLKQNKGIKNKFEISGTKDKLNELAAVIVEKVAGLMK